MCWKKHRFESFETIGCRTANGGSAGNLQAANFMSKRKGKMTETERTAEEKDNKQEIY